MTMNSTLLDAAPSVAPVAPAELLQTGKFRLNKLEALYVVDARLEALGEHAAAERADLLARRARMRLELGFSELAVADVREARELRIRLRPDPAAGLAYVDDARLAEALRVDARDRLLSKTSAEALFSAVGECIELFNRAQADFAVSGVRDEKQRAWLHGHLAAVHTMKFWIVISENPSAAENGLGEDDFNKASENFARAIAADPSYSWAYRFRAHLHALRGKKGDFEFACEQLQSANQIDIESRAAGGDPNTAISPAAQQSSFQRSLAMLFSYVAVQSDNVEAALRSITAGIEATALDPDEFHAPHSVAASLFWLAHHGPVAERAKHAAYVQPAIDAAYLHARNSVSRASGVLASLALMKGLHEDPSATDAAATRAKQIIEGFETMGVPPDLETRAFSYRTPTVALLRKLLHGSAEQSDPERVAVLRRTFEPMLEELTTKLAIPDPKKRRSGAQE